MLLNPKRTVRVQVLNILTKASRLCQLKALLLQTIFARSIFSNSRKLVRGVAVARDGLPGLQPKDVQYFDMRDCFCINEKLAYHRGNFA